MTFYNEEHAADQRYRQQQEVEQLLSCLVPNRTRVRIAEHARQHQKRIGTFTAYHPEKDFPFEISIGEQPNYFAVGQFTLLPEKGEAHRIEGTTNIPRPGGTFPCPYDGSAAKLIVDLANKHQPVCDQWGNVQYYCLKCSRQLVVSRTGQIISSSSI